MRITFTLALAALLAAAPSRTAAAILNWNDCASGAPQVEVDFDCDTNAGQADLVVSFVAPAGVNALAGIQARIRIATYHCWTVFPWPCAESFPSWWQVFGEGACRSGSMEAAGGAIGSCPAPWCGDAGTGAILALETPRPGFHDLVVEAHPAAGGACALVEGTEYTAMALRVRYDRTVGEGACGGCVGAMGIVLEEVRLVMGDGTPTIVFPEEDGVLWNQRGAVRAGTGSWGALKSGCR